HMAVEFEEPEAAIWAFQAAGIKIGKIQVSAGLRVLFNGDRREQLTALARFSEGVYLHQVVEQKNGRVTRYADLPQALLAGAGEETESVEWRIHFHVPLFREQLGRFTNTQDFLRTLLKILRYEAISQHLEIETYSWNVLPEEYRHEDIVTSVVREMQWVLEKMAAKA
ncbi:MAG: metabolite traffic protein EboE, partial [Nitrospiraceae bacterium]